MTRSLLASVAVVALIVIAPIGVLNAADLDIPLRYRLAPPVKPPPVMKSVPPQPTPPPPAVQAPPVATPLSPQPSPPSPIVVPRATPERVVERPVEAGPKGINPSDYIFLPLIMWLLSLLWPFGGAPLVTTATARTFSRPEPTVASVNASSSLCCASMNASSGQQTPPVAPPLAPTPTLHKESPVEIIKKPGSVPVRPNVPMQDGWAEKAGNVREPFSAVLFRIQARSNIWALREEQARLAAARGVMKEYVGMYDDLRAGQDAANAYGAQRDLGNERYDAEMANQKDDLEQRAHKRKLNEKRRVKEQTEADHEQEALEKFKDEKFEVGGARYKAKVQEHLAGAASAEAAIVESRGAGGDTGVGANESSEVSTLHDLLQKKQAAIDEAERLGKDTQALREQLAMYERMLNLT